MSERSAQPAPPSREQSLCRARSLAANIEALCEALDASLPLNDPGRLELAEIAEEIATWSRPLRERVPVDVQRDYYERLVERADARTKRTRRS